MMRVWKHPERPSRALWNRSVSSIIGLGLLCAVPLSWMAGSASAGDDDPLTALGFVRFQQEPLAPDFTLPDLEGTPHRLHDLKGQAVLLVFWTTW
jgi:cytochrome oxidase Cu insertion factor (SCO1/SenC/PrrC family)